MGEAKTISPTFKRLARQQRADKKHGVERGALVATVGPYAVTKGEDLYFRALNAAIVLSHKAPQFG